jgi:predicted ABC-type ATPase
MIENQKVLYIVAGANGSGKTTFAMSFSELENMYFINADEIAKRYDPKDIQKYKIKAGKTFFIELGKKIKLDESFVIETTLSGKYLIKVIEKAKENGFKVVLLYLFLENNIENILRVKNRVLGGGHNVPQEDIVRRYYRSKKLFNNIYKTIVDEWMLFYNGDDKFELVANNDDVIDEVLYKEFLKDIG